MVAGMQSGCRRSNSSGDEQVLVPRSPTSTAVLEQDLQNINEQTQTLHANKVAAEQRCVQGYVRTHDT